jgi:hypothetical protein
VGFFNKKKQSQESNVTWDDIQNTMFAPDIPSEVPAWFSASAVDPTTLKHLGKSALISADSWFNVETAAVYVGTRIPEPCEECNAVNTCKKCGKSPKNYLKVMSANQDCDVLLWRIYANPMNVRVGIPDGGFIFFDQSVYSTIAHGDQFNFTSQALAPVVIGELDVKDVGDETGILHFADASAQVDENYFFSNIRVNAGRHKVVAWMGYTRTGELAPQALGVYGPNFSQILESDLATAAPLTPEIKVLVEGDESGTVLARFGNNQEYFADQNQFLNQANQIESISWKLQLQMEENKEKAIKDLTANELQCTELLSIAVALRVRGKKTISEEIFNIVEKYPDLNEFEGLKESIPTYKALAAGQPIRLDAPVSAFRLNLEAHETLERSGYESAKEIFIKAAERGLPNALGSLTWYELKTGNYAEGIRLYERSMKKIHAVKSAETINCDSNYALLLLANDEPADKVFKVWASNIDYGHTETIFFSAMLLALCESYDEARELAGLLSPEQWDEMKEEMQQEAKTSTGWFKEWCDQGSEFIKEYRPR